MRTVAGYFLAPLKFFWALPWTAVGVSFGVVAMLSGGRGRIGRGVVEFWGGTIGPMLTWLPLAGGAGAITFGHTILARTRDDLESSREHELVHVRQYERWGPLFIPAYLLCSLVLRLRRKSPYFDNPFEQEAYGTQNTFVNQSPAWLDRRICLALVAASGGLLAGSLSRTWWVWELATHFRMIYLFALALVALLWWITGRFWRSIFVGVITGWIAVGLIPFYRQSSPQPPTSPTLRVLAANLLSKNLEYDLALDLVRRESPDVLVVLEVNARWGDRLAVLSPVYPYHKTLARPDNFGIALYSRLPLEQINVLLLGDSAVPSIVAQIAVGGRRLSIIGVHVLPPIGSSPAAERNASLVEVARLVREQSGDVLVIGDLNCTSWSPYFDDLLAFGNLRDSRLGFGLQPSWPVMPGPIPVLLPIDHCLVSSGVIVHSRRLGSAIGSDHLPIVVDVSLR